MVRLTRPFPLHFCVLQSWSRRRLKARKCSHPEWPFITNHGVRRIECTLHKFEMHQSNSGSHPPLISPPFPLPSSSLSFSANSLHLSHLLMIQAYATLLLYAMPHNTSLTHTSSTMTTLRYTVLRTHLFQP